MSDWDTTALIALVRTRAAMPPNVTDAAVLKLLNDAQKDKIVPLILRAQKSLFERYTDTAIVDGQERYPVHSRAIGASPVDIQKVTADGTPRTPPLARTTSAELPLLPGLRTTGNPTHYYFEGDDILLWPMPSGSSLDTLRQRFLCAPSKLVLPAAVGVITSISAPDVTCSGGIPATITSSTLVDLVKANPHFTRLAIDQEIAKSSNTATFSSLPAGLAVGDYLCLARETPVPNYPEEFHGRLVHEAVLAYYAKNGDAEGIAAEMQNYGGENGVDRSLGAVTPRGRPQKFVSRAW